MRWEFDTINPAEPLMISAKTNQIAMPAVSQTTNGTLFVGFTLNPTLKTTQKTKTMTIGLTNVHMKPNKDPMY